MGVDENCANQCIHIRYTFSIESTTARSSRSRCSTNVNWPYQAEKQSRCTEADCRTSSDCVQLFGRGIECVYTNPRWSTAMTDQGTGVCMKSCRSDDDCTRFHVDRSHPSSLHKCLPALDQQSSLTADFKMCRAKLTCHDDNDCLQTSGFANAYKYPVFCNRTNMMCQEGCKKDSDCIGMRVGVNGEHTTAKNRCKKNFELVHSERSNGPTYARHCEASDTPTQSVYSNAMKLAFGDTEELPINVEYISRCDVQELCTGKEVNMTLEPQYHADDANDIIYREYKCCSSDSCVPEVDSSDTLTPNVLLGLASLLPVMISYML
jgi:hypothetical protein